MDKQHAIKYSAVRLTLAGATLIAAAVLYPQLPTLMPVHWNLHMHANGWAAKPWGVWVFPVITTVLAALAELLPLLSPKGYELKYSNPTFQQMMLAVTAALAFLTAIVYAASLGLPIAADRLVGLNLGLMFAFIGNVMSKTTRNFFIGIRTPWTLASDEVWLRTHRLGGRLLLIAGLVLAYLGAAGFDAAPGFYAILLAMLISVGYSFVLYRKLGGEAGNSGRDSQ